MLKQTIIKTPIHVPAAWAGRIFRQPHNKLTDEELATLLIESPFNKGDLVWMGPEDQQQPDITRMGYIVDIEWDSDKLYYDFKDTPKPFVWMSLNMCGERGRNSLFQGQGARPHCRWESCDGYSVVGRDLRAKVEDDYVQNYIKTHSPSARNYIT